MALPLRAMVGPKRTNPTTVMFRDATDTSRKATRLRHSETSVKREIRASKPASAKARLERAAELGGQLHDELEAMLDIVSRLPLREQDRALALGLRHWAERWHPNGVADLPPAWAFHIRREGVERTLAYPRPDVRADQYLLKKYGLDKAGYSHLMGRDLREK